MKSALFGLQSHSFSKNPILVIDRDGLIGEPLSLKLSKEFLVVFVSRKNLALEVENQNIIHVPFFGKFPIIPDNKYSHVIFIGEEEQDLEFLPKIINKVKDINADFIFAQGLSPSGEYAINKILRLYPSAKVAIFGDIFDDKLILKKGNFKSVINKFICHAQRFGRMHVLGDGLKEVYPVFLPDVVGGLIDLVFGVYKNHSLFYIFPKHPPSELSLAHMIQKTNPEITIDFIRHDPRLGDISYPPNGINLLGDKYPISQKIRSIDIKKKVKAQNGSSDRNTSRLKRFPFFIVWTLMLLLLFPFIFTVFFSFLGKNTFYYAKEQINRGNFVNAKGSFHLSQTFYYLGKQTLNILFLQAKIVGYENNLERFSQDLDLGYKISESLSQAVNSETYFSKILNGKSENPTDDFAKGKNYLKSSIVTLGKIKAEEKISAPILQNLETISPLIELLSSTIDIMPNIFGMEGPKTYLILFQNNMELRPCGGLIGSYGILKFNLGKITQFTIHDVYDADGQLRGHVEPPFAIRRYLQEKHWYMRDSNFDVDFIKSASSSSNFLFVETGQKADGVIAVDTSFVKSVLHAIGPVYVEDYKETVNENNLYALALSHVQSYFSSGSMKNKDFLRSLNKTIITKIKGKKVSGFLIAQAISDALTQKHLMFVLNNNSQNIFTVNGWSSSLWDERKDNKESLNDFAGINEANLGLNNVNYFIRRLVVQKVAIENNGGVSEELTINYKNENTAWPGGDYINYLRIILPKNVNLSEISIDDNPQDIISAITDPLVYEAKNFKVPQGLEVEKTNEDDKTIFGFIVKVPSGKIVKIKLKYALAGNVSNLNTFSYSLKLFKQPGIDSIPYSFSFTYPNSFNIIKSSGGVVRGEGKASYSGKIMGDKSLIVSFTKK